MHGKELLHFAACQMLFVPGGFAVSFLILPVRANPAAQGGHKAQMVPPCSCPDSEQDYPDYRTKITPKVREIPFRSVTI